MTRTTHPRRASPNVSPARRWDWRGIATLVGLLATLPAIGWVVLSRFGLPRLPAAPPSWQEIATVLRGSEVPVGTLGQLALVAFWCVWLWFTLSLVVEVGLSLADLATHGAAWVQTLRARADGVTVPLVRRAVHGAIVVTAVAQLVGRPAIAGADPLPAPPGATVAQDPVTVALSVEAEPSPTATHVTTHVVRRGDTLWGLAQVYLGSGFDLEHIREANLGRTMPDGTTFRRESILQPGWTLVIPQPHLAVEEVDGERVYVVQPNDSLEGIAARLLGDAGSWDRVFALNRGVARLPDGRTLQHPDLIWPGLRLRLPQIQSVTQLVPIARTPDATRVAGETPPPDPSNEGFTDDAAEEHQDASAPLLVGAGADGSGPVVELARDEIDRDETTAGVSSERDDGDVSGQDAAAVPNGETRAGPLASTPMGIEDTGASLRRADGPVPVPAGDRSATTGTDRKSEREVRRSVRRPWPAPIPAVSAVPVVPRLPTLFGTLGAAGLVGLGGAAVAASLRRRRSLYDPPALPEGVVTIAGDYAAPDVGRVLAHRTAMGHEVEPAVLGAEQMVRLLAASGHADATIVTVLQEERAHRYHLTLSVRAGHEDRVRLVALAPGLGRRLGGTGRASITPDGEVEVALRGLTLTRLRTPVAAPVDTDVDGPEGGEASLPPPPLLVPVGARSSQAVLYANWWELGHLLLAGWSSPGQPPATPGDVDVEREGSTTVLVSLVAALAARGHPAHLGLWTIARAGSLPAALAALPHQQIAPVDPGDRQGIEEVVQTVVAEFRRRQDLAAASDAGDALEPQPELVVVIGELADLVEGAASSLEALLDAVGRDGPAYGIRLLAATARPAVLDDETAAHFTTRAVLVGDDSEERSVRRLLGWPAAALPDGAGVAGELLLRIGARHPVRLRGFRLGDVEFGRLVELMREVYRAGSAVTSAVDADPSASVTAPSPVLPNDLAGPPPTSTRSAPDDAVPVAGAYRRSTAPAANGAATVATDANAGVGTPARDGTAPEGTATVSRVSPSPSVPAQRAQAPRPPAARSALPMAIPEDPGRFESSSGRAQQASAAEASDGTPVRVRCFAPELEVWHAGVRLVPRASGQRVDKAWELLAVLAAYPTGTMAKEKVMTFLWPDDTPDGAFDRLDSAVYRLRRAIGEQVPVLRTVRERVVGRTPGSVCRLQPTQVTSDVHRFLACLDQARQLSRGRASGAAGHAEEALTEATSRYEEAVRLYGGELLEEQRYSWLDERGDSGMTLREYYRAKYDQAVYELAGLYERGGRLAQAVVLYERLALERPMAEDPVRCLYRCYQRLGDRHALEQVHDRLVQALRAGGVPEAEPATVAAYAAALGEAPPGPGSAARRERGISTSGVGPGGGRQRKEDKKPSASGSGQAFEVTAAG